MFRASSMLLLLAALGALALPVATAAPTAETSRQIELRAARMLDVKLGRVIENVRILIVDGRIASVSGGTATPKGDDLADGWTRIDLGDMTILPGLIDMHTHLDSDPTYGGYSGLQFTDRFWSMLTVAHAASTLEGGFTTVRNVGADAWNDVGLRQAVEAGKVRGPRVVSAGYSFGATGGHCDSTFFPPSFDSKSPYNADSPEEGRKRVREIRKHGAQVIKICATGGVFSRNTEPGQQQMSEAEMRAIVEEAHQWGLKVAAHAHGTSGIKAAIRAGVDTIEHASLIDDEGIALAKKHGAWLSMDIYNTDYTQAEGRRNGVLEDNLRKDREIADVQREGFRRAHAAGAKMIYGTDAGVHPHGDNGRQFAVMVRYGMTPIEAIRSATLNAAEALGRDDIGVLEPGRHADLIAVPGDPTANVQLLESIPFVMKGGIVEKDAR
jgi:imidazolonepropionase-like amidohydrolase